MRWPPPPHSFRNNADFNVCLPNKILDPNLKYIQYAMRGGGVSTNSQHAFLVWKLEHVWPCLMLKLGRHVQHDRGILANFHAEIEKSSPLCFVLLNLLIIYLVVQFGCASYVFWTRAERKNIFSE